MSKRKIIRIDEEKCNGCGDCVPSCVEGAIKIIDGKAKLVSETYCDGLGACLGHCPQDAITIEEREAEEFNEQAALKHVESEKKKETLPCGCPGTQVRKLKASEEKCSCDSTCSAVSTESASLLENWPVQLRLVPVHAPYFDGAKLLIAADCAPFAYRDFHARFIQQRTVLVGCPKLDDAEMYKKKLADIFRQHDIQSIEVAYMEVPCCHGLVYLVQEAIKESGRDIPLATTMIGTEGSLIT
jgi:Pyruvate/2-oxoacid:ferredoxin oxidoreductase delta subunit